MQLVERFMSKAATSAASSLLEAPLLLPTSTLFSGLQIRPLGLLSLLLPPLPVFFNGTDGGKGERKSLTDQEKREGRKSYERKSERKQELGGKRGGEVELFFKAAKKEEKEEEAREKGENTSSRSGDPI